MAPVPAAAAAASAAKVVVLLLNFDLSLLSHPCCGIVCPWLLEDVEMAGRKPDQAWIGLGSRGLQGAFVSAGGLAGLHPTWALPVQPQRNLVCDEAWMALLSPHFISQRMA